MNRRAFLSALGLAPVAGVASALPVKADAPKQSKFRAPAAFFTKDTIINFEGGSYWFERNPLAATSNPHLHESLEPNGTGFVIFRQK